MFQRRRLTAAVTLTAVTVTWAVLVAPGSPGSAAVPVDGIQQVSVGTNSAQLDANSSQSAISADGTQIAFESNGNLAPSQFPPSYPNSTESVFVRNTRTDKTFQISVGETSQATAAGLVYTPDGQPPTNQSMHPSISADGRYVSFVAAGPTNVVATAQGFLASVVVCDRDPNGDRDSSGQLILDQLQPNTTIPDYRCVVIASLARDVADMGASRPELDKAGDRIVWSDGCIECATVTRYVDIPHASGTGQVLPPNTAATAVPTSYDDASGTAVIGNDIDEASLSGDGNHIVAVATTGARRAIVKYDIPFFGSASLQEIDASPTTAGRFFNDATTQLQVDHPRLSDDGRYVVFDSPPSTADAIDEAWVVDTTPDGGALLKSSLVSVGSTAARPMVGGLFPAISGDGRYIAFLSDQTLAHDGQSAYPTASTCLSAQRDRKITGSVQTPCQTVVRDRVLDAAREKAGLPPLPGHLASPSRTADCGVTLGAGQFCVSDATSSWPLSLSLSGYRVAFSSYALDIVDHPDYGYDQPVNVYVRTWLPSTTLAAPVFGNVPVGTTAEKFITITAKGFGPIPISGTTLTENGSSTSFRDNGYTCVPTTAGLTVCSVSISFSPLFPGPQSATVDIYTLDPANPKFTVPVSATGVRVPPAKLAPGDTTRTSVTNTGGQAADGGGSSMISGNGRWDVFTSIDGLTGRPATSTNPYQSPAYVYVRDLANPQHTIQISLHGRPGTDPTKPTRPHAEKGAPTAPSPNGGSFTPSISDDGRFVSFITYATDIVPTNGSGLATLVVCDRDPNGNGVFDEVQPGTNVPDYVCYAVDAAQDSSVPGLNSSSNAPRLSGDGTRIAWTQYDPRRGQPFQHAEIADLGVKGGPLQAPSGYQSVFVNTVAGFDGASTMDPVLSQNGQRVVLVARGAGGGDLPPSAIVEVDLASGTPIRMDREPGASTYIGDTGRVADPAMSASGLVVAFEGSAGFETGSVYVARRSGSTVTTFVGSRNNSGVDDTGFSPALSGDGRYLAFVTGAPNMHNGVDVPGSEGCGGTDGPAPIACQVVARDLTRDAQRASAGLPFLPGELVSASVVSDCGTKPANASCAGDQPSSDPSIDLIGSEIGFDSDANDLVPGDTNDGSDFATGDAFVHTWRPALTAAPVAFGGVQLGASANRSFAVTAAGFGPVSMSALQTSGPNASDFTVPTSTCAGAILHAKSATDPGTANSCTATVTFTPAALGARSGFLSVRAGPNTYPVVDPLVIRPLTGTGTKKPATVPQISTNPSSLNFGTDIPLHLPGKKKTIVVGNPGGGTLTITGATVTDTTVPGAKNDYTVDFTGCSGGVPAGGTCDITVTFIGHAIGTRPAIITITDNASGGPVQISVTAVVPKPRVTVNPGVTPTGRVVAVSGVGFAPNRAIGISFLTSPEQAEPTADAAGKFSVPLVIFPNADEGPRTIVAKTLLADPSLTASTPLLVQLGTLESPRLVIRH